MLITDKKLLEQWADGDRSAAGVLMERHFDAVYRFFRNKTAHGVDDLVQGTFLGCLGGLARFRGQASFRTYLFQTARYQLYEYYRRLRRQAALDFDDLSVADLGTSPTGLLARHERNQVLLSGLRSLPLDLQIALELSYWEDLKEWEIADVLVRAALRRGGGSGQGRQNDQSPSHFLRSHDLLLDYSDCRGRRL